MDDIPNLINTINGFGENYYNQLLNISLSAIKSITTQEKFQAFISYNFMLKVKNILELLKVLPLQIGEDCKYLINTIFFANESNPNLHIPNIRSFYLKKIVLSTTKDENDLLTYENCLRNKTFKEMEFLNFTVQPAFVVGMIDDIENKTKLNGSILNEKYN